MYPLACKLFKNIHIPAYTAGYLFGLCKHVSPSPQDHFIQLLKQLTWFSSVYNFNVHIESSVRPQGSNTGLGGRGRVHVCKRLMIDIWQSDKHSNWLKDWQVDRHTTSTIKAWSFDPTFFSCMTPWEDRSDLKLPNPITNLKQRHNLVLLQGG